MVRSMLNRIKGRSSLVQEAARLVQALTGFDRVMIYRFHPDGSGEVIAERVRSGVESFLGLRYPASDIPQQARALLVRNPVRVLIDVGAAPSPLVLSADEPDTPLDLSMSVLRAHSMMHVEYLQNMGVGSTMTVSLVRDGKLWGMISCHHMAPRHVGFEQRTTAELFAEMLSLLIAQRERADVVENEVRTNQLRQHLIATVVERGSTAQTIARLAEGIKTLLPCDGIAVYSDGVVTIAGDRVVHDGDQLWIVQLHAGGTQSLHRVIVPGVAEAWARFEVGDGLIALRSLLGVLPERTGVEFVGEVGLTSHLADLMRKAQIPTRFAISSP